MLKKMRKQRFKTIRLFLKLILFFQTYSHHCLRAAATENQFPESFNKGKVGEETRLNDQISGEDTRSSVVERPIRPVRLLPMKIIR